jgi:hypothetical protein
MMAIVLKFLMLGQPVKIKLVLIQICLLCMMLLPAVLQAQFIFTTNADNTITIWGYTGDSSDVMAGTAGVIKAVNMASGVDVLLCLLGAIIAFGTALCVYFWKR